MNKIKYYRFEQESPDTNFVLKEKLLYGAGVNCFLTRDEAWVHFEEANKIAQKKYESIMEGIDNLKNSLGNFSYEYFMHGDTYGIYEDGLYIQFEVNGYDFMFLQ